MNQPLDLAAHRARRQKPYPAVFELPPCDMPIAPQHEPQPRPVWPVLACFGFPFLLALVIWLVLTSLKP